MLNKIMQHQLQQNMSFKTLNCGRQAHNIKRQLRDYFIGTFDLYEKLYQVIKNQRSLYTKPQPLRHPLIFYFGHSAAFFVNKLLDKGLISQRINQSYERMFAVGVDQMDWDDLNQSHYEWPSLENAKLYRQKVKTMVCQLIEKIQQTQLNWNSDLWIILMGIEHERIHLQTSSVIIRRLPIDEVQTFEWFKQCPHSIKDLVKIPTNLMKKVSEYEKVWDRQKQSTHTYGWDNQFGHKIIKTKQYSASQMLVSNGEYFEFWKDEGYKKMKYWTEEGQNWLKSTKVQKPLFWQINSDNAEQSIYYLRTITRIIQMPWDWPVEVNNLQAQAFCKWKGQKMGKNLRLPTQDQYYAMRSLLKKDLNDWKHGQVGNINLEYWLSPNPVNMFETEGFFDIVGNLWQHTVTPIYPFQGFQIHPIYEDFTTPTFDNRHSIIKGGSFISTGNEALYHARYAFRRHFYQFAGFRYVQSENTIEATSADIDQSDQSVQRALKTQFIDKNSYIEQVLLFINKNVERQKIKKSLVVGCSVGRLPLEFSKSFPCSYGIDYTARYFQMATRLHQQKYLKYRDVQIELQKFNMKKQDYQKVHLYQMNPENTDSKKINEVNLLVIDGISIRKNTLKKSLINCLKLLQTKKSSQIIIITDEWFQKIDEIIRQKGFKVKEMQQNNIKSWSQKQQKQAKIIYIQGNMEQE